MRRRGGIKLNFAPFVQGEGDEKGVVGEGEGVETIRRRIGRTSRARVAVS